jgi:tripartite-type tricarboxylate transporter receptor subunit TctC
MQKVPYKPLKTFTFVAAFANIEHTALAVRSDSPFKTFGAFRDYAKNNPGKVKYSTLGVGSGVHVPMEIIARKDGIKWVHVPYKGSVAATMALLGGHVDACSGTNQWFDRARAGEVTPLATHGRMRTGMFPDVPTLNELGYDFAMEVIQSIVGPAGLPAEVVKKLETAVRRGTESPEFKSALDKLYIVSPRYMTSREYDLYLKETWIKTETRFKEVGIIKEAATQPY